MAVVEHPLVSIVTPSYNQGEYIRHTIDSVLSQDYPRLEYVVVDGASTDGTRGVLEAYTGRLTWISEPDRGQAHAINKGFRLGSGEILGWLNSDDVYLPAAVAAATEFLVRHPDVMMVYGEASYIDEAGRTVDVYPTEPFRWKRLGQTCFICQPAVFFRRAAVEAVGYLNETLHYALDYDLWLRIGHRFPVAYLPRYLAQSRQHLRAKSVSPVFREALFREIFAVVRHHFGYVPLRWRYCYAYCALLDRLGPRADRVYRTWLRRAKTIAPPRLARALWAGDPYLFQKLRAREGRREEPEG